MWLFEIHDEVRPGFRVSMSPGPAHVLLGRDDACGNRTCLPIGHSIRKYLEHEDDADADIRLNHARLEERNVGLILVRHSVEEAREERKALALVYGCSDPELGETRAEEAWGHGKPEQVTFTQGDGCRCDLYVFRPGDALYIHWPATVLGTHRPKKFIAEWDGEQMKTRLFRPRQRWPRSRLREETTTASMASELRQEA